MDWCFLLVFSAEFFFGLSLALVFAAEAAFVLDFYGLFLVSLAFVCSSHLANQEPLHKAPDKKHCQLRNIRDPAPREEHPE